MATIPQPFLFSWKEIDEASDLDRLRLLLDTLPEKKLVVMLAMALGRIRIGQREKMRSLVAPIQRAA